MDRTCTFKRPPSLPYIFSPSQVIGVKRLTRRGKRRFVAIQVQVNSFVVKDCFRENFSCFLQEFQI